MDDFSFDFERTLEAQNRASTSAAAHDAAQQGPGGNKPRNYRQVRTQPVNLITKQQQGTYTHAAPCPSSPPADRVHLLAPQPVHEGRHVRLPAPV